MSSVKDIQINVNNMPCESGFYIVLVQNYKESRFVQEKGLKYFANADICGRRGKDKFHLADIVAYDVDEKGYPLPFPDEIIARKISQDISTNAN